MTRISPTISFSAVTGILLGLGGCATHDAPLVDSSNFPTEPIPHLNHGVPTDETALPRQLDVIPFAINETRLPEQNDAIGNNGQKDEEQMRKLSPIYADLVCESSVLDRQISIIAEYGNGDRVVLLSSDIAEVVDRQLKGFINGGERDGALDSSAYLHVDGGFCFIRDDKGYVGNPVPQ